MSLKILVDMNLSVEWVPLLTANDWQVVHWSTIGDPRATDTILMAWRWRTAMLCSPMIWISGPYWP
jgi:predicted nuclease of predicted toxin-antitoxin system